MAVFSAKTETVVALTPPVLSAQTVLKQVVCARPVREGRFNISAEKKDGKQIIHCYGHGGSGWSTLFASVSQAIDLFEKTGKTDLPIRVLGAGCIGQTMAIELSRKGYQVVGITADHLYDIASWRAGGYFGLVSVKNDPEEQDHYVTLGLETLKIYHRIERGDHPYLQSSCLRYLPVFGHKDSETGLELLEDRGLLPPKQKVVLDFGSTQHRDFFKHMSYYLDTTQMMRQIQAEVARLKIGIEIEKIDRFGQIAEPVVFNCTGLGARELNGDSKVVSAKGHLILLNDKAGSAHMQYMIYGWLNGELLYMFPKTSIVSDMGETMPCKGVLGGTFLLGTNSFQSDEAEFQKMFSRAHRFFHGTA